LPDQKDEEQEVGKESGEVHHLRKCEYNAALLNSLNFS
jgi:hypothetical protein